VAAQRKNLLSMAKFKFKVKRFKPEKEGQERDYFDVYEHEISEDEMVLTALIEIQREKDPTLSMRYSCRSAVCGSCSMKIEGRPRLACKTKIKDLGTNAIKVEPLPNMPVVKDLVVDLESFFASHRSVKPYFMPKTDKMPKKEQLQSKKEWSEVENFSNCIMCAVCVNACPVLEKRGHAGFKGPAALMWAYRFIGDSRDGNMKERVKAVKGVDGVGECNQFTECHSSCPKDISPSLAIRKLRSRYLQYLVRGK